MKKLLIAFVLLVGISQTYAQNKTRKVSPGIRGGWSLSTVTNTEGDYRTNFYVGLQLPIRLVSFYTLQPEVVYSRQGVDNIGGSGILPPEYRRTKNVSLDYVDINIINKFHFGKVNLQAGPGLAVYTGGSESSIMPIDLTLNLGIGIDITKRLGVEARWMPGLIDIDDSGDYYFGERGDYMRNNTFQIGAYYSF